MANSTPASARPRWLAAAVLIGLTVIAYWPALNGGFVWDDDTSLNRFVKSADGLRQFWLTTQTPDYWPVTSTTFWFEWRLWGTDPLGYHVTNLALHLVECLLLWAILRRLRIPGAYLAALLFAVHPVNVQSVAWITQRKGLMAMLFYLASIYAFVRWNASTPTRLPRDGVEPARRGRRAPPTSRPLDGAEGGGRVWYAFSLLAFALAMLSKGSVAILPVVLLGILSWRRRIGVKDIIPLVPFLLVAGILALVDVWFQKHNLATGEIIRNAGWTTRLLGAGAVVWFYLLKALVPVHLVFFYPLWHIEPGRFLWWVPMLAVVGLSLFLWRKARLRPQRGYDAANPALAREDSVAAVGRIGIWRAALFAWVYFCVALIPVMGFTDVYFMKFSLVEDHYQHLALIGVVVLTGALWAQWQARSARAADIVAIVVVALLAGLTWRQGLRYHDAETLLETSLRENPDSALGRNNLGVIYAEAHRLPDAMAEFTEALRLDPTYADAQRNAGLTLARQGHWAEAIPYYQEALRLNPSSADTQDDLGNVLLWLNRPAEAIPHFEQAVRLNPVDIEALGNLAIALDRTGRPTEAIERYGEALRVAPANAVVHVNLAYVLMETGRVPEAVVQFEQAVRLRPDDARLRSALDQARGMLPAPSRYP
jgi:protein O-mannosyl-transferase